MNLIKLAWKNLAARPLSMLLTLVLFALGVGLTSLLLLLNHQLTEKFEKNLAGVSVVMGAKGSPLQLILCNMYHVDVPTGNISLKSAKPFLNPRHPLIKKSVPLSLGDSYKSFRIVGTLRDFIGFYGGELAQGNLWSQPLDVTIGATVAAKTALKIGDKFASNHGLTEDGGEHDNVQFRVVGIFKPSNTVLDQLILTATESIWTVHAHEEEHEEHEEEHGKEEKTEKKDTAETHADHDHASEKQGHDDHDHKDHDHSAEEKTEKTEKHAEKLSEKQADVTDDRAELLAADSSRAITSVLLQFKNQNIQTLNFQRNINQNTDMQAATPALEINRLFEMMGVGERALRGLALLIVIVSGLSVFIALFSSLRERQYELSLMRVMGAGRTTLFLLIVLEGLLLSFMGFLIGIALSHLAMQSLAGYMTDAYRYSFSGWTWLPEEGWLLAGSLLIGFLAAVIPAINAYRINISRTLSKG